MNCSDLIVKFLADNGVEHLFGIPGYANSALLLSTRGSPRTRAVLARHEANAAWMAYGYALTSGKFGACTGTSGAGTTNILSAIAAAYYNSVPVLVVTGQVETNKFGKGAFQELTGIGPRSIDVMRLFAGATKMSRFVGSPDELPAALTDSYAALFHGRPGPVHLNVPVDVLKAACPNDWSKPPTPPRPQPAPEQLKALLDLLDRANAPLLLVGRGCRGARAEVDALLRKAGIPYCTTIQGRGLVAEDTDDYLGVAGIAGSPRCNTYIEQSCDLIIAVGTSLGEFSTNGYSPAFCRDGRLIHVNIDAAEFGKSIPPRLAIEADAAAFCASLTERVTRRERPRLRPAAELTVSVPRDRDVAGRVAPMDIVATLAQEAPRDAIFLADSGNNAVWATHYLRLHSGQAFLIDVNTGCMGSGVVSAIGAKLAAPRRPVISICGDGGFMMNGVDVATAAELELPIVWVVFNDAKLGMVKQGDEAKYGASVACEFRQADIAAMARAYGADAEVVTDLDALRTSLAGISQLRRPLVLDVKVNDGYLPSVYARVKKTTSDRRYVSLGDSGSAVEGSQP